MMRLPVTNCSQLAVFDCHDAFDLEHAHRVAIVIMFSNQLYAAKTDLYFSLRHTSKAQIIQITQYRMDAD